MTDLYDEDIVLWSERQAALLRRVASGERADDPSLDWPNIIEELESVGRSDLYAVQSFLVLALLNILKATGWPESPAAPGWRAEAWRFRFEAQRRITPTIRQRLDLADLYRDALRSAPEAIGERPPRPMPATCPFTLDELLSRDD